MGTSMSQDYAALRPRGLPAHLAAGGPKRILSIDGGGVRGLLTCGLLEHMERALSARLPENLQAQFRLCHYFDLIGGTSTGAVIASLLALGFKASEIAEQYDLLSSKVFGKARALQGLESKFDAKVFASMIDQQFEAFLRRKGQVPGTKLTLDSRLLETGLLVCSKRIDTGSPWVLTNNPKAKYWDPNSADWAGYYKDGVRSQAYANGSYELSKVVQASASAPFYLDPIEKHVVPGKPGLFLDGGVSPFNNPAQQTFLMATAKWREPQWHNAPTSPWGFGWGLGQEQLLLISLGTGHWRTTYKVEDFKGKSAAEKAFNALRSIIPDTAVSATTWLQALSESPYPSVINREIGDMRDLRITPEPLLSFQRVDVQLDDAGAGLTEVLGEDGVRDMTSAFPKTGLGGVLAALRRLDNAEDTNLARLRRIGDSAGALWFSDERAARIFPKAFDLL